MASLIDAIDHMWYYNRMYGGSSMKITSPTGTEFSVDDYINYEAIMNSIAQAPTKDVNGNLI